MYEITRDYIKHGDARGGQRISTVRFIVSHDIGKGKSTAYQNQAYFNNHQPNASAHTFVDDKFILEIVPIWEKAWHVRYNVTADNEQFGDDANDCAIGVELCHGGSINFEEAYKRYVWYHAYLCKEFGLNPRKDIVPHSFLDPGRRSDPQHALSPQGISWERFISDVDAVFRGEQIEITKPKEEIKMAAFKRGDKGAGVGTLQTNLKSLGYKIDVDNSYGPGTESVVKQFQKANNLVADGMAGPQTLGALAVIIQNKTKPTQQTVEFVLGGERFKITKL